MPAALTLPDVPALVRAEGRDLGVTSWHEVDQARIGAFAEVTGDRQWIHVDVERARRDSPFGGPIAHGYLTVAMIPALLPELIEVERCARIVNSGIESLRLREAVPAGARIRLAATLKQVRALKNGAARVVIAARIELEGAARPACIGDLVYVYFPEPDCA